MTHIQKKMSLEAIFEGAHVLALLHKDFKLAFIEKI